MIPVIVSTYKGSKLFQDKIDYYRLKVSP